MAWRFFTGLGVYLEAILAFVLATEQSLSPASVVVIGAILIAQLRLVWHPARQLLRGELVRSYRNYLVLVAGFVLAASLGSHAGDARIVAAVYVRCSLPRALRGRRLTTIRMADCSWVRS